MAKWSAARSRSIAKRKRLQRQQAAMTAGFSTTGNVTRLNIAANLNRAPTGSPVVAAMAPRRAVAPVVAFGIASLPHSRPVAGSASSYAARAADYQADVHGIGTRAVMSPERVGETGVYVPIPTGPRYAPEGPSPEQREQWWKARNADAQRRSTLLRMLAGECVPRPDDYKRVEAVRKARGKAKPGPRKFIPWC